MSYYEAITILVSIFSFGTTTFFAYLVYKLSKQGNELSKQANDIATELLSIQRQEVEDKVNVRNKNVKEEFFNSNEKNIIEFNEDKQTLQKKKITYPVFPESTQAQICSKNSVNIEDRSAPYKHSTRTGL